VQKSLEPSLGESLKVVACRREDSFDATRLASPEKIPVQSEFCFHVSDNWLTGGTIPGFAFDDAMDAPPSGASAKPVAPSRPEAPNASSNCDQSMIPASFTNS